MDYCITPINLLSYENKKHSIFFIIKILPYYLVSLFFVYAPEITVFIETFFELYEVCMLVRF